MTWTIETYSAGSSTIRHKDRPRFSARWTTGELPHGLHQLAGPVWTDEFQWTDPPPDQAGFEQLMREAVREIDRHIGGRS